MRLHRHTTKKKKSHASARASRLQITKSGELAKRNFPQTPYRGLTLSLQTSHNDCTQLLYSTSIIKSISHTTPEHPTSEDVLNSEMTIQVVCPLEKGESSCEWNFVPCVPYGLLRLAQWQLDRMRQLDSEHLLRSDVGYHS